MLFWLTLFSKKCFSDPLANLEEIHKASPTILDGSGSDLFGRSISFGTSSESENENKDKLNDNGEEEVMECYAMHLAGQ